MASENGVAATDAPPLPSSLPQASSVSSASIPAAVSVESLQEDATRATASLKRARESTPTSPSAISAQLSGALSPSKAARIIGLTSRPSPAPLTAAAAIEDERHRAEQQKLEASGSSENPAYRVQSDLMSAPALAMSRPHDAPSDLQSTMAPSVSIPTSTAGASDLTNDVSPHSATSLPSLGSAGAPVESSPAPMDIDQNRGGYGAQPPAQMEDKSSTSSLSYPGILPPAGPVPAPSRGMSMPGTQSQPGAGPKSPSSKKHKCPYCETVFTRHHNLKSHLLTHSQEKPYVCQGCQMRFRRLHDLKRHSKLHTGEKPHICPKCHRKFARGDALARHSKGPGGCVGRRPSFAEVEAEEEFDRSSQLTGDDSTMTGVIYEGAHEGRMTEEERRRLSLPAIKAQHVAGSGPGRLFPPNVDRASGSSQVPQAAGTTVPLPEGGAMYAQSAMTESPKPLSPGLQGHDVATIGRQRSPSLTTQFQQQHFGRHQTDRNTPPVPGFPANDSRYAATSGAASQHGPAMSGTGVTHSRTSSGQGQSGGSGDSNTNNIFATDHGIWAYIHNLEEKLKQLVDRVQSMEQAERLQEAKIEQLTLEITTLRTLLDTKTEPMATTG